MYTRDEVFVGYTFTRRKNYFLKMYNLFVTNKDLQLNEFMTSLCEGLDDEIDFEFIKKSIKYVRRNISSEKGIEMYNIWCNIVNNYRNVKSLKLKNND